LDNDGPARSLSFLSGFNADSVATGVELPARRWVQGGVIESLRPHQVDV